MKSHGCYSRLQVMLGKSSELASYIVIKAKRSTTAAALLALASIAPGCSALTNPINGIPARRLPSNFFTEPKSRLVPIDVSRLGQEPPREYLLDGGDILGVYIEGVLPFNNPDQPPPPPPVNFPAENSLQPPSLGYPIAVQEDGAIALPLIKPLKVKGLTVEQVRELIRKSYLDSKILNEGNSRVLTPIVTIIQERTVAVVVIRQDLGATQGAGSQGALSQRYLRGGDRSAAGNTLKLRAYQNDVLHALMQTGGLPGLNAKNEVRVLRATSKNTKARDEFVRNFYAQYYSNPDPCGCPPPLPDDPSILKIPLRMQPGVTPTFRPEDMILNEGDVVYIDSREAEVFYTGGLLQAGEFPIPRDYDLDVLGAMALAGTGVNSQRSGGFGGLAGTLGAVPPGRLYIVRKLPCDGQVTIEVDINKAINNPRDRPLIQPGDTLILQYKPQEELLNFGLGSFFTYGIQSIVGRLNR